MTNLSPVNRLAHLPIPLRDSLLLLFLTVALLLPRLPALGSFVTADEPTWGKRSASFYYALAKGDWEDTDLTGHPGVTTMWAGAFGYFTQFSEYERYGQYDLGDIKLFQIFERHGPNPMLVLAAGRLMVALGNSLAILAAAWFALRLFGLPVAVLGILLIAFEPLHVAHSRVLHTNAFLSSFLFASLLGYLYYLKTGRLAGLVVSAAAGALAYLSITPAIFLTPALALITLWDQRTNLRKPQAAVIARQIFVPLALWGIIFLVTIFLVWPAMWSDPIGTLWNTLRHATSAAEGEIGGAQFMLAYESGEDLEGYWYFYPLTYLWRTTPVVLVGLLLLLPALWRRPSETLPAGLRTQLAYLGLFILFYTLAMSLGAKKYDRYYLPAMLAFDMLAAAGWVLAAQRLGAQRLGARRLVERWPILGRKWILPLYILLLAGIQAAGTLHTYPYYLSYYNPLLGGSCTAPQVMAIGWGEGLNEAARYLQQKPEANKLRILTWYPLAFDWYSHYLFGYDSRGFRMAQDITPELVNDYMTYDYAVVYINQRQRNASSQFLRYLETLEPEYTVWINGLEYVHVYKIPKSIP